MADEARRKPAGMGHRRRRRWRGGEAAAGAGEGGGRAELGEALVGALLADFERHLRESIEELRSERPLDYLRLVAVVLGGGPCGGGRRGGRRRGGP